MYAASERPGGYTMAGWRHDGGANAVDWRKNVVFWDGHVGTTKSTRLRMMAICAGPAGTARTGKTLPNRVGWVRSGGEWKMRIILLLCSTERLV